MSVSREAGQVFNPDGSPMQEGPDDWTRLCDHVVEAHENMTAPGYDALGKTLLAYALGEQDIDTCLRWVAQAKATYSR